MNKGIEIEKLELKRAGSDIAFLVPVSFYFTVLYTQQNYDIAHKHIAPYVKFPFVIQKRFSDILL